MRKIAREKEKRFAEIFVCEALSRSPYRDTEPGF
jgi:hypothetical protein